MKQMQAMLAVALLGLSAGAAAHGVQHAGQAAPATKEQKDWGIAGDATAATRTIEVAMSDTMRFTPASIQVKQGETVRFVVRNGGKLLHEMVLGTKKELDEHAALMTRFPNMQHDEPYMTHVQAGRRGEIVWTFNRPGDFQFGCLIPGHYQAGMVGRITVLRADSATRGGQEISRN